LVIRNPNRRTARDLTENEILTTAREALADFATFWSRHRSAALTESYTYDSEAEEIAGRLDCLVNYAHDVLAALDEAEAEDQHVEAREA
jgi:hypothetical protein